MIIDRKYWEQKRRNGRLLKGGVPSKQASTLHLCFRIRTAHSQLNCELRLRPVFVVKVTHSPINWFTYKIISGLHGQNVCKCSSKKELKWREKNGTKADQKTVVHVDFSFFPRIFTPNDNFVPVIDTGNGSGSSNSWIFKYYYIFFFIH